MPLCTLDALLMHHLLSAAAQRHRVQAGHGLHAAIQRVFRTNSQPQVAGEFYVMFKNQERSGSRSRPSGVGLGVGVGTRRADTGGHTRQPRARPVGRGP